MALHEWEVRLSYSPLDSPPSRLSLTVDFFNRAPLKLQCIHKIPRGLSEMQLLFWFSGSGAGSRCCSSDRWLGDAELAGPRMRLGVGRSSVPRETLLVTFSTAFQFLLAEGTLILLQQQCAQPKRRLIIGSGQSQPPSSHWETLVWRGALEGEVGWAACDE